MHVPVASCSIRNTQTNIVANAHKHISKRLYALVTACLFRCCLYRIRVECREKVRFTSTKEHFCTSNGFSLSRLLG